MGYFGRSNSPPTFLNQIDDFRILWRENRVREIALRLPNFDKALDQSDLNQNL